MIEFFLSFLACIVILVGLFFGFFILLGVLRGLPYIFKGLAARWSDDPCNAVRGLPPRILTPVKGFFVIVVALLAFLIFSALFTPRPNVPSSLQVGFEQSRAAARENMDWIKNH
jgi:hypothetical protein